MPPADPDYRELFEFSLDAIIYSDETGLITLWNPASEKMFGYTADEIIGQPLTVLMPKQERNLHNIGFKRFLATGKATHCGETIEVTALKKDGSHFPVELSLSSKKTSTGYSFIAILRDITTRKSDTDKLKAIFSNISNISIQGYDENRKVTCWNHASESLYGYSYEEALNQRLEDLIIPEDMKEYVVKSVDNWLNHDIPIPSSELTLCKKDGSQAHVYSSHVMTEDIHGKKEMYCIDIDISPLARANKFKEQTNKILTMIATGEPSKKVYDAIALIYEERHPGMRCSTLELRNGKLMHGGAPSMPQAYCDAVNGLENGPCVGSCGTSTFTGKRVLVEDIATDPKWAKIKGAALPHGLRSCWSEPIKDSEGQVLGAFGMYYNHPALPNKEELHDLESAATLAGIVMERERRQSSLRKLSQAIEQAAESIIITDEKGSIEYVNPAFTAMTGYTANEVLGKNPRILKSGNQDNQYYEELWDTISSGNTWQKAIIDRRKDGSLYPAIMSIAPIFDHNHIITHYVGTQQDMTEYQNLELQFQQAQKMEAIGTLVGGIAHDFNNMLASISANMYLAKIKIHDQPEITQKLESAEEVSFHAANMIKQLLTFARKDRVKMESLALSPFIKETIKFLRSSVPENIAIEQDISTSEMNILGDHTQLHQIMMNLINNARDALEHRENPCIKVCLQPFYADESFSRKHINCKVGNYACLCIEDNGQGIEERHIKHLFEPFFTTKPEGKGTGLGLAMVFGAVERHKGFIHVNSEIGKGTTFHIYLPLLKVAYEYNPNKTSSIVKGNGETILLVDDQQQVIETIQEVLESLGYQVLTASNGEDAVRLFKLHSRSINLLILDVVMPVMGGYEAAKEIRAIQPHAKIIFATGYDKNKQSKLGNEDVISKPFSISELSQLIRQKLDA